MNAVLDIFFRINIIYSHKLSDLKYLRWEGRMWARFVLLGTLNNNVFSASLLASTSSQQPLPFLSLHLYHSILCLSHFPLRTTSVTGFRLHLNQVWFHFNLITSEKIHFTTFIYKRGQVFNISFRIKHNQHRVPYLYHLSKIQP